MKKVALILTSFIIMMVVTVALPSKSFAADYQSWYEYPNSPVLTTEYPNQVFINDNELIYSNAPIYVDKATHTMYSTGSMYKAIYVTSGYGVGSAIISTTYHYIKESNCTIYDSNTLINSYILPTTSQQVSKQQWTTSPSSPIITEIYPYQAITQLYGTSYLILSKTKLYADVGKIYSSSEIVDFSFGNNQWIYNDYRTTSFPFESIEQANNPIYNDSTYTNVFFNQTTPVDWITFINPVNSNIYTEYPSIQFYSNNSSLTDAAMELYFNGEKYWSKPVNLNSVSVSLSPDTIPYKGSGNYTIKIMETFGTTMLDEISFTIALPDTYGSYIEIPTYNDGSSYVGFRDLIIRSVGYNNVSLYLNEKLISSVLMEGNSYFNYYQLPYVVGTNIIKITDSSGTVLKSISFTLLSSSGVPQYEPGTSPPSETKINIPVRSSYPDGFIGDIQFGFDTLFAYIKMPFQFIASLLNSMTSFMGNLLNQISGVIGFVTELFSFLPKEITQALSFLIMFSVLFFIIKMVRG